MDDIHLVLKTNFIDWRKFENSHFLITGGTGLLGSLLTKVLLLRNLQEHSNISISLVVRDVEKAKRMFLEYPNRESIFYIVGSIETVDLSQNTYDYIVHTAAPTKSNYFIENPIGTIESIVLGTMNVLKSAINQPSIKGMVNVSSMESYGILSDKHVTEDKLGEISLTSLRSSYPESKRLSELLCFSYSQQHNINVCSMRLAQTFGAEIIEGETRVFKYFSDCIVNNNDIILRSSGETIVNFCYLSDAISAILVLLTKGEKGETYNVCGESYQMTIKEIAKWIIELYRDGVNLVIENSGNEMFAPVNKMVLNNEKIKKLGWNPMIDIKQAYQRLIESEKLKKDKLYDSRSQK